VEFDWTPQDQAYRAELQAYIRKMLPAGWRGYDQKDRAAYKTAAKAFASGMAEHGWLTQNWPKDYGGAECSAWRQAILGEELTPIGEPRGSQYMNVNWIGPAIMRFGTEAQKQYHLRRIAAGDVFWCQGFSEPDAGSDLGSLRTRAVRDGDDYVVSGSKIWTSHVGIADFCILLVRTGAPDSRARGISVLLVPMGHPGFSTRHIASLAGDESHYELFFDEMRVPVSWRLGEEDQGWEVVRWALQYERVGSTQYQRAALQLAETAEAAIANGAFEDPEMQSRFGEAWAACQAARMLTLRVYDLREAGSPPTADSNLSRLISTDCLKMVAQLSAEVLGLEALDHEGPAVDAIRNAALAVAAGAAEIQLDRIAMDFLGLPRGK
jgi:alkylation response protein AidB-like acyl-CoA dehydrogenase